MTLPSLSLCHSATSVVAASPVVCRSKKLAASSLCATMVVHVQPGDAKQPRQGSTPTSVVCVAMAPGWPDSSLPGWPYSTEWQQHLIDREL